MQQADVRRQPVDAQRAEPIDRIVRIRDPGQIARTQHRLRLPAGGPEHPVAGREPLRAALLDDADAGGVHYDAGTRRAGVAGASLQARAGARGDRERARAHAHLRLGGRLRGRLLQPVVGRRQLALRKGCDHYASIGGHAPLLVLSSRSAGGRRTVAAPGAFLAGAAQARSMSWAASRSSRS